VTRDDLLAISREPNVAAFLRALRLGEGTRDDAGYRRIVGGSMAQSLADHPRQMVWLPRYGVNSSAAGAYQFLSKTWDGLVRQYGFPDFSEQWQDAGAVGLIIGRKALDAVRKGDIRAAIALCRNEWASLPGSPYGQRTEAMDAVLLEYKRWGGTLTAGAAPDLRDDGTPPAPIEHRDTIADPADVATENRVDPLTIAGFALPLLREFIPQIAKIFKPGSEVAERNVAAATAIVDAAVNATDSVNVMEAIDKMQTDPAAVAAVREAVLPVVELIEAGGGGIDGARKFDLAGQAASWQWNQSAAFLAVLLLLPLVYMAAAAVLFQVGGDWPNEVRASALMMILGIAISIGAFYWGSSNKPSVPGK
jgi:muramidase (phage lysozyme)